MKTRNAIEVNTDCVLEINKGIVFITKQSPCRVKLPFPGKEHTTITIISTTPYNHVIDVCGGIGNTGFSSCTLNGLISNGVTLVSQNFNGILLWNIDNPLLYEMTLEGGDLWHIYR